MPPLVASLLIFAGCNSEPASSGPPKGGPPRGAFLAQSPEQIGRNNLGSAFVSVRVNGDAAEYTFAPSQIQPADKNVARMLLLGGGVIDPTFKNEKQVKTVRVTAVDPANRDHKLLVYSLDRAANDDPKNPRHIDWHNPSPAQIARAAKMEYTDPTLRLPEGGGTKP